MPIPLITGAVATGIPLLLHMIHRRKAQRVLFPTIRFLKASNERTSRRQRIQDLLLLLMRMLLFFLCGFALDSQCNRIRSSKYAGLGRAVNAVILLDNSYSMGTVHEGRTRFEAAKQLAMVVVDSLPDGSQAAVLYSCPPAGHPKPLLESSRDKVRNAIHKATLSQARADMTAAVQRAYDFLLDDPSHPPTLEVYALTDLQRNAWSPPSPHDEATRKTADAKPQLVVVDVGREDHRNVAVTDLIVRGGARVRGRPVGLQARIQNFSPQTATVNVTLYVDRAKQSNQQLDIPGNLTATASFHHTFDSPGVHTGWVQTGDDSLPLDNRRDFSIDMQSNIPAVLYRESQGSMPHLDPDFFVAKALDPYGDDPTKTRALVQTTVTDFAQITHDAVTKFRVAVLIDPGSIKKSEAAILSRYVRRGGRLIIFCGPSLRPAALNPFLNGDTPQNSLMPVTVREPVQGFVSRRDFKSLVNVDIDHPALRIFKDYRRLVQTAKIYNFAPIDVEQTSPARILIGLSDGSPFLLENSLEKGRVLLFSSTTDPDWSNLGSGRFLVPLLHRLVYYLTERSDVEGSHLVGAPVQLSLRDISHPVGVQVRDPDGEVIDLAAKLVKGTAQATFSRTDTRGPYLYLVTDPKAVAGSAEAAADKAERGFVVNLDPQESDLAKAPAEALARQFAGHRIHFAATGEELRGTIERMREGIPLRNLILFIVLVIAIFETFFANRIVPALQRADDERHPTPPAHAQPAAAES
ncbi:BatA domain-containing protein [bacterium]|nr:BatA domain-containing protein [bacterium]